MNVWKKKERVRINERMKKWKKWIKNKNVTRNILKKNLCVTAIKYIQRRKCKKEGRKINEKYKKMQTNSRFPLSHFLPSLHPLFVRLLSLELSSMISLNSFPSYNSEKPIRWVLSDSKRQTPSERGDYLPLHYNTTITLPTVASFLPRLPSQLPRASPPPPGTICPPPTPTV